MLSSGSRVLPKAQCGRFGLQCSATGRVRSSDRAYWEVLAHWGFWNSSLFFFRILIIIIIIEYVSVCVCKSEDNFV